MQADELKGLHAELELSPVVGSIGFNSRVHFAPSQCKRKEKKTMDDIRVGEKIILFHHIISIINLH